MNPNHQTLPEVPPAATSPAAPNGRPSKALIAATVSLTACFSFPLYKLIRFALESDLYSYILLIPVVSVYLFWTGAKHQGKPGRAAPRWLGAIFAAVGLAALASFASTPAPLASLANQDGLASATFAYVALLAGIFVLLADAATLKRAAFPLLFLIFLAPFPAFLEHAIESFLQRGSAPPAFWMFKLAGTPVFKNDMVFQLPGITLQVAPECSGIRSTLVLFMTSLIAGHLFLRSPWKRTVLAVIVIPLALVRNAFRIFTIGELCVHVGPHMIHSAIHHKGGPIFFVLSLIPFFLLVFYLVKTDQLALRAKSNSVAV